MKKSKFTEQQIAFALQEAEGGTNVAEVRGCLTSCSMARSFTRYAKLKLSSRVGVVMRCDRTPGLATNHQHWRSWHLAFAAWPAPLPSTGSVGQRNRKRSIRAP